jgi:hypothetical protein
VATTGIPHLGIGDLNQALAKIDLKLLAGAVSNRIVARACPANARRYGATARLDPAQADEKALLGDQLLANDVPVAAMALKPLPQPALSCPSRVFRRAGCL